MGMGAVGGSSESARDPAVTVVIPCFNQGRFVDEAVESVLAQSRRDFEIVIVNDGSTDTETNELLAAYDRPETRVITAVHRGLAAARNLGIQEARGRYICALDADDRLAPAHLERTAGLLDARPDLAFVSCWLETFGDEHWVWRQDRCDFPALLAECTVCTAALVRRDAVLAVGGYDEHMPAQGDEDWDLWISLVAAGYVGTILPEVLFHYRRTAGSMSSVSAVGQTRLTLARYLVEKHKASYEAHLLDVLLLKEDAAAVLLRDNHELERRLGSLERAADPVPTTTGSSSLDWGDLATTRPFSEAWGTDRGLSIARYYIEPFLESQAGDIRGRVLEVHDSPYAERYGGTRVTGVDVVDIDPSNPRATIVADLRRAGSIASDTYDCFVMTQTLHLIDDIRAVADECLRILKPGGVLLATFPTVSRVAPEQGLDGDFWRFTSAAIERLFGDVFGRERIEVSARGNVLTSTAFLYGLAAEDLTPQELDADDPSFPLIITLRATRPGSGS